MIDQETLDRVVGFHGHMCAGLALGIRAAEVALAEVGAHAPDEEVVAVVETDMCAVDAIQFLTGCTFGKGNLVHLDHGKNAYTFIRRSDGRAVRVSTRPGGWSARDPEWLSLFTRVRAGTATPEERAAFATSQKDRSEGVLHAPLEELYDVREVTVEVPRHARILASVVCEACGEATMETRVRRLDGRELCLPCFEDALAGTFRVPSPGS
ncbi:MAG TPA: FmdE family protein [Acidimicrobiales bacterium]|nr:FmdE family protein [Acidimicrobiales bacterium]